MLDNGKEILASNFVFNLNRNFLMPRTFHPNVLLTAAWILLSTMIAMKTKSTDLEKRKDARLNYLKRPLIAYLNINNLRNKVIDLREIISYLYPDSPD